LNDETQAASPHFLLQSAHLPFAGHAFIPGLKTLTAKIAVRDLMMPDTRPEEDQMTR